MLYIPTFLPSCRAAFVFAVLYRLLQIGFVVFLVGTFAADWADASLLSDLASFSRVALFEGFSDVNRLAVTSVAVRCDGFF